MEERQFKGVWISQGVWLDDRLTALDKIILVEIDSLDNEETGCYATNEYLANFCQCGVTKISTAISKLIELDYIYIKSFDGRQRILKSRLSDFERQGFKKCKADFQKVKENNIIDNSNNNKINNKEINKEIRENIYLAIDYLNEKTGARYRKDTSQTVRLLKNILSRFTLDDIKNVIDKKCEEWQGTEYETYLRPMTLFGSKFENYLNSKVRRRSQVGKHIEESLEGYDHLFG
jgi:uncharacterized phage protein (TIGR02220 family)